MHGRPRILAALAPLAVALAVAGCGSGSASKAPQAEALSYLPKDTPIVALVATDPNGAAVRGALSLAGRFPQTAGLLGRARAMLAAQGLDFTGDIVPLLGNDFVIGVPAPGNAGGSGFVAAVVVPDAAKLKALFVRQVARRRLRPAGRANGATLYAGSGSVDAVRGADLVVADTVDEVKAALAQHDKGGSLTPGDVDAALGDLPRDALVRVDVNLAALLAGPQAARARKVPWVAALRSAAVTISPDGSGLLIADRIDTSARKLAPADVPFAPGDATPTLRGAGPVVIGLRDPAHFVRFVERAASAVNPVGGTSLAAGKTLLGARLGIDVDRDLIGQLSGSATVSASRRSIALVADLRDPAAMRATLAKIEPFLASTLAGTGSGARVRSLGSGGYAVGLPNGTTVAFGVAGGKLVAGTESFARLARLAATTRPTPRGARGSLVESVALGPLLRSVPGLGQAAVSSALAGSILRRLGAASNSQSASPSQLEGQVRVSLR